MGDGNSSWAFQPHVNLSNLLDSTNGLMKAVVRRDQATEAQIDLASIAKHNLADAFFDRLYHQIKTFDEALDQDHEVGVRLVSFGQTIVFHVEDLGFQNPSLIIFIGRMDDGQPVRLVQHVSQISFLLTSMKRTDPSQPKRPFGFTSAASRQFAEKAERDGCQWDNATQCWIAPDGAQYDREGNVISTAE